MRHTRLRSACASAFWHFCDLAYGFRGDSRLEWASNHGTSHPCQQPASLSLAREPCPPTPQRAVSSQASVKRVYKRNCETDGLRVTRERNPKTRSEEIYMWLCLWYRSPYSRQLLETTFPGLDSCATVHTARTHNCTHTHASGNGTVPSPNTWCRSTHRPPLMPDERSDDAEAHASAASLSSSYGDPAGVRYCVARFMPPSPHRPCAML
jgi:hypothetical protein